MVHWIDLGQIVGKSTNKAIDLFLYIKTLNALRSEVLKWPHYEEILDN